MAGELRARASAYHIEILGINRIGYEAGNAGYTTGTTLPWLQDQAWVDVRSSWGASDREIYILDPNNEVHAVFNTLTHSLETQANRNALKALLLQAAQWTDSDNDKLCDHWEKRHFGNLTKTATGDPDGDGRDNFTEYAFGTNPSKADSCTPVQCMMVEQGGQHFLQVEFNRRMGAQVSYKQKTSTDLAGWAAPAPGAVIDEPLQNLFDGSGTGRAVFRTTTPAGGAPPSFFRMLAEPAE
jgi:hypothetical protein